MRERFFIVMICSVCSVFVHGYFWNFIISNGNHENAQCVFSFVDPQRSIKFSRSVCVLACAQNATFIKKLRFGLTKRNFTSDFFQKALFGLKMWKQTGTKCLNLNSIITGVLGPDDLGWLTLVLNSFK